MKNKYYLEVENIFSEYIALEKALDHLLWDTSAVMPIKGIQERSLQLSAIKSQANKLIKAPKLKRLLAECENEDLDDWQKANLNIIRQICIQVTSVNEELQSQLTIATANSEVAWREAKANNNFLLFKPHLTKVLDLTREIAKVRSNNMGMLPYDCMLNMYDPKSSAARIEQIFSIIEPEVKKIIPVALRNQNSLTYNKAIVASVSIENQKKLVREIVQCLGFDLTKGRCDESIHPFTRGTRDDARITTCYNQNDFLKPLLSAIHETGHAVYLQNTPKQWQHQPLGFFRNMTLQESQALFFEYCIGSSYEFLRIITPIIQEYANQPIDTDELFKLINFVEKGFIRRDADELTYPLHIIHRFRVEKQLIDGELEVKDLPDAWNSEFENLFGIKPSNDTEGCLQDIHWSQGSFGYFPTYCLGAIVAVQLLSRIESLKINRAQDSGFDKYQNIIKWLNKNIHEYGAYYPTNELIQHACLEPLNPEYYIEYLKNKFIA